MYPELEMMLKESGRPWTMERGKKHVKLRIDGKLIAVLSNHKHASRFPRHRENLLSTVRRYLKQIEKVAL